MEIKTYNEFIQNILNTRGRFACGDEYHERHHIIPRCMDGDDEENNLIDLFAREHFIAHKLLAEENPDNDSLVYAWTMMSWAKTEDQKRYQVTSEEYEEARIALSKLVSERVFSEETIEKMRQAKIGVFDGKNNPMYGKHHTQETRDKISAKKQGKPSYNKGKPMSEDTKQKIREQKIGKKYSDEVNKKKGRPGDTNPFYGKHHTEETKALLRDIRSIPIRCVETGAIYKSRQIAEEQTGVKAANIWRSIKSKGTAGGYHWEYISE